MCSLFSLNQTISAIGLEVKQEITYKAKSPSLAVYTLKKQKLKITQLEKVPFIKVNELKLTEVELF